MVGGRPLALGVSGLPSSALATANWSGARRQATGVPGVVWMWCVVLFRLSQWLLAGFLSPGNSSRWIFVGVPPTITFTLWTAGDGMRPSVDSDVTPSSRRLFLQSTRSPQCDCRSTPMIGSSTSAITKRHMKSQRSPRFRHHEVHPYVGMVVPLAACNV